MKILVKRFPSYIDSTLSEVTADGAVVGVGCEDIVRAVGEAKVYGKTAIPAGTYRVIINRSNRFSARAGRDVFLPLLLDLPDKITMFGGKKLDDCGIRIHTGNKAEDTEGCLLIGTSINADERTIAGSKIAFDPFMVKLKAAFARKEQILITFTNP